MLYEETHCHHWIPNTAEGGEKKDRKSIIIKEFDRPHQNPISDTCFGDKGVLRLGQRNHNCLLPLNEGAMAVSVQRCSQTFQEGAWGGGSTAN